MEVILLVKKFSLSLLLDMGQKYGDQDCQSAPEIQIVALGVQEAGLHHADHQLYQVPGGPDQAVHLVEGGRLADGLGLHERLQALAVFRQVVGLSIEVIQQLSY